MNRTHEKKGKGIVTGEQNGKTKYKVGIVTLSDKGSRGEREDLSGPKIQELLPDDQYEVVSYRMLPDEQAAIEKRTLQAGR
mgnify:CR=1 FL=1